MSRPNPPSLLTSIGLSVASDLADTLRNRSFYGAILVVPALFALLGAMIWWSTRPDGEASRETVLLVVPDASLRDEIQAQLDQSRRRYEVIPARTDDSDSRLEAGNVEAIIELSPDFRETASLTVRAARGASLPDALAWPVRDAWLGVRAASVGGTMPALRVDAPTQPEGPENPATKDKASVSLDEARKTVGSLLLFFAAVTSLSMGVHMIDSAKNKFNRVLSIGTPMLAIFLADTLVVVLTQLMHFVGWGLVAWVLIQGIGVILPFVTPPAEVLVRDIPALAILGGLMLLQALGLAVTFVKVLADVPDRVQRMLSSVVAISLYVFLPRSFEGLLEPSSESFFPLPVLGLWQLWTAYVGDIYAWTSLALQVGWAALSMSLGAWAIGFDEAPQTYLRRRLKASSPNPDRA